MINFIKYYKPYQGLFLLDLLCAVLIVIIDLIYPTITRNLLNNVIPNKNIQLIITLGIILFSLYIFHMIFGYIIGYCGHLLGAKIEHDMRKKMFAHVQSLSFHYFDNTQVGNIISRIMNDLNEISELAHHGPEDIFTSLFMLVGSFVLLCRINILLTIITFVLIPFMIMFILIYNKKMRSAFRNIQNHLELVNAKLEDRISGIKVIQSFANESYEKKEFNCSNQSFKNLRSGAVRHIGIFYSGLNFFSNLTGLVPLIIGSIFVVKNIITTGDLVAFIMYTYQFLKPITRHGNLMEQFQQGMAGFYRFEEFLATKPDIVDHPCAIPMDECIGDIEFKNVSFSYDGQNNILSDVNLKVNAGETVAILGPSGAGKSTLCSLIPRFYEINHGSIHIDGVNIQHISLHSLRKNIGILQQDVFLFSGTLWDNIVYGNLKATDEQVLAAAKAANAHNFIMEMPEGYHTHIGERGLKLSDGQKQRISIARMFLKNPTILILDEPTSSLDNESEVIVQQSIKALSEKRTTFIIAYRPGTITHANRIVVLSENGIEEFK